MNGQEVYERLVKRFGFGTRRELREALYKRLRDLVEGPDGYDVYLVIVGVAADAAKATDQGRYFSKVVMRRLLERGLLPHPEL